MLYRKPVCVIFHQWQQRTILMDWKYLEDDITMHPWNVPVLRCNQCLHFWSLEKKRPFWVVLSSFQFQLSAHQYFFLIQPCNCIVYKSGKPGKLVYILKQRWKEGKTPPSPTAKRNIKHQNKTYWCAVHKLSENMFTHCFPDFFVIVVMMHLNYEVWCLTFCHHTEEVCNIQQCR